MIAHLNLVGCPLKGGPLYARAYSVSGSTEIVEMVAGAKLVHPAGFEPATKGL